MSEAAYAINGQPCSSEAFYALACDPARSVVVQACAGAGKTWVLVSRMLRALLAGCEPHEILAITFTKKAAGEIRERLQEWLHTFSQADDAALTQALLERGFSKQMIEKSPQNLREQLSKLYQTVLLSTQPMQICTFHAWFNSLLSACPLAVLEALGLPLRYELLEDDSQAAELALLSLFERMRSEAKNGHESLLRCYFEAVADVGRSGVETALRNALARRTEFAFAYAKCVLQSSMPAMGQVFEDFSDVSDPLQKLEQHGEKLRAVGQIIAKVKQSSYAKMGVQLLDALEQKAWENVPICLLTQAGEPRKFSEELRSHPQVQAAQQLCVRVQAACVQHAAWLHQERMTVLSKALIECHAQLKRERGWVDMADLERAAHHLLQDEQLCGWVQERLDARTKHLLIDEFQDTNPLQWQALHSWLASYLGAGSADRPSLFIVGDAKQSIYRFRRAEPQVFEAATRFVCQDWGGQLLSCDHTRRNSQAVIAAVNALMGRAVNEQGYAFREHTTGSLDAGTVIRLPLVPLAEKAPEADQEVWRDTFTEPRDEIEEHAADEECRNAARWLAARLNDGIPAHEVMVLSRKRDRLLRMRDALRDLGIESETPDKTALIELPEVQDVIALLDVLISPTNDLALARALKSPLFAWNDADLTALACAAMQVKIDAEKLDFGGLPEPLGWLDLLQNKKLLPQVLRDKNLEMAYKFDQIGQVLADFQALLAQLPPHDALQAIYERLDAIAVCMAAAPATLRARVASSLQALLQTALQASGGRFLSPHNWLRQLKRSDQAAPQMAVTQGAGAVRLLTIHGAKGLEAKIVLLLDSYSAAPKTPSNDVLIDWPGQSPAPTLFAFLRSETHAPACVSAALAKERAEREREEINALYVAMTRAKTLLAFSGHSISKPDPRCPWLRLEAAQDKLGDSLEEAWAGDFSLPAKQGSENAEKNAQNSYFSILNLPKIQAEYAETAPENIAFKNPQAEPASRASLIGQCMHRLLELYRPGIDWQPLARSISARYGLTAQEAEQALRSAQSITQGAAAWVWDETQIDFAANEVELAHQGQLLRLDRVVRRSDTQQWWILDYKLATRPEAAPALREQLKTYTQALRRAQKLDEEEAIRAAFITAQGEIKEIEKP